MGFHEWKSRHRTLRALIPLLCDSRGPALWMLLAGWSSWWSQDGGQQLAGATPALQQPAGERWATCCSHEQGKTFPEATGDTPL